MRRTGRRHRRLVKPIAMLGTRVTPSQAQTLFHWAGEVPAPEGGHGGDRWDGVRNALPTCFTRDPERKLSILRRRPMDDAVRPYRSVVPKMHENPGDIFILESTLPRGASGGK